MTLLETLVLGSYIWSFILAGALYRKLQVIETNHLAHLEQQLERALQQERARRRNRVSRLKKRS